MLKKRTFFSVILFLLSFNLHAQGVLNVLDPQSWWSQEQGTIEEATLAIKPHGIYMEYSLYLTFSARNTYFSANDILEVEFYFDLPKGAIVNDLWLWIGDDIMKAQIMDQWTASSIYEQIVNRRQDPAILIKRGKQNYELRVYPMDGDGQRKVKMNYFVPIDWHVNTASTNLPMNIITASKNKVDKFNIIYFPNDEWKNPNIYEHDDINFVSAHDSANIEYLIAEIPSDKISNSLTFSLSSPMKNGIYVNAYNQSNEGVYQLAYLPSFQSEKSIPKKVTFLIDYMQNKSSISLEELLSKIRLLLNEQFTEIDSFNVLYSKLEIQQLSDHWLPVDSVTIENVLGTIISDSISFYSNLPSLLSRGIEFVKNNGNDGNILLIANSDLIGEAEIANQLLKDLQAIMDNNIPIHIADFNNINYQWYWVGGRYYYGNEYFYLNLSRITHSNYQSLLNNSSINNMLESIVQSLSGLITSFDLHTTLENGFCFGRFNSNLNESIYMNNPITQIGKFMGEFPLQLEVSGVYNSEVFTQTISVDESDIFIGDNTNENLWAGNYISSLETGYEGNEEINNIINLSLENRILSLYTSFIALEPGDSSEFCYDCPDESDLIISVDDEESIEAADSLFIQAYPNPFNPTTTLNVNLPKDVDFNSLIIKIYNILGEEVISFNVSQYSDKRNFQLKWNGTNNYGESVSTGIYFFVLSTKDIRKTVKLMMMK